MLRSHRTLSDVQLVEAMDRLAAGRGAVLEAGEQALFTERRQWTDFEAALAVVRDPSQLLHAREALLKIGRTIEARQRPNAERMGWA